MNRPDALTAAEARLRQAILSESHEQAGYSLKEYCAAVERAWHAAPDDVQAKRIAKNTQELLEWARRTVLAGRSHAAVQMQSLSLLASYARRSPTVHAVRSVVA